MDNKIIIGLIKKEIEEIKMLVEALEANPSNSKILIDICRSKANTLLQEVLLLTTENEKPKESSYIEQVVENNSEEVSAVYVEEVIQEEIILPKADKPEHIDPKPEKEIIIEEIQISKNISEIQAESAKENPVNEETETLDNGNNGAKKIIGERFSSEPSLNERFASLAQKQSKFTAKPIRSLKKEIGINDRFLFARELFNNNMVSFEAAVEQLDKYEGLVEAINYLEQNFSWQKNEASLKFIEMVKRRFNN